MFNLKLVKYKTKNISFRINVIGTKTNKAGPRIINIVKMFWSAINYSTISSIVINGCWLRSLVKQNYDVYKLEAS